MGKPANQVEAVQVESDIEALIRDLYGKFNERDLEGALSMMRPDVEWANGMQGGFVLGTDAVREYWTRQWGMISSTVTPQRIWTDGPDHVVEVHQAVRSLSGKTVSDTRVLHVFRFTNGKIASMRIEEPIE